MNDIFWGGVNMLVNTLPSLILTYIPFRNKVKVKARWAIALNGTAFAMFFFGYVLLSRNHFSFSFLQEYKLMFILPGVLIAFAIIEDANFKIFYFNLMMITYIVVSAKAANYIAFSLQASPDYFMLAMSNLAVFSVTLPSMIFYQNRLFRQIEEVAKASETDIWKIIWVIPLLFVLLCLSSNLKFDIERIRELQFIIMNILTAAGMFISTSVLLRVLNQAAETALIREAGKVAERQLIMQREQYKMMTENIASTNAARHDLRHHISVIKSYADLGDAEALQKYLSDYQQTLDESADALYCQNNAVNAIVRHYASMAKGLGIKLDIDIDVPHKLGISDLDLSVIFGNCMENAIEACTRMANTSSRYIRIKTRLEGHTFAFVIINSFDGKVMKADNQFLSRKRSGTGIGISSVSAAAKKYGGTAEIEATENEFWVSVMLFLPCTAA